MITYIGGLHRLLRKILVPLPKPELLSYMAAIIAFVTSAALTINFISQRKLNVDENIIVTTPPPLPRVFLCPEV